MFDEKDGSERRATDVNNEDTVEAGSRTVELFGILLRLTLLYQDHSGADLPSCAMATNPRRRAKPRPWGRQPDGSKERDQRGGKGPCFLSPIVFFRAFRGSGQTSRVGSGRVS